MTADEYLNQQSEDRRALMRDLHEAIIGTDKNVTPVIELMMGKQMIIYKECSYMKYGLASVKNYMSLHCLPIYMNPQLHALYAEQLPAAKVQKGCINFNSADELPIAIANNLFADCSKINIAEVLEKRKRK